MAGNAQGLGSRAKHRVIGFLSGLLTRPVRNYEQRVPNSLPNLKQHLRKGDVLLVQGDQRVSQVIRYLTQSSWSHTAMYIGDDLRRLQPARAQQLDEEHGEEAKHLVIEATLEQGVACAPVSKYVHLNLRVCRPRDLRPDDYGGILESLIAQIGYRYDVRHVLELGRYFFPMSLIPRRLRPAALRYGGGSTREVICSTMLARAFGSVGFPIRPRITVDEVAVRPHWLLRMLGRNGNGLRPLYREQDPALVTPRDFDLSPYFDIVKFNYLAWGKFDYRHILWEQPAASGDAGAEHDEPQG
jgi:hypothetical protein